MERDYFVAGVAITLGLVLLFAGMTNNHRCFEMRTPKLLAARFGRPLARSIVAVLGLTMVFLGGTICWGRLPFRASSPRIDAAPQNLPSFQSRPLQN